MRGHMEFHCPRCGALPMEPCAEDGAFRDSHAERIEARAAAEWTCDTCGEHECECLSDEREQIDAANARTLRLV